MSFNHIPPIHNDGIENSFHRSRILDQAVQSDRIIIEKWNAGIRGRNG